MTSSGAICFATTEEYGASLKDAAFWTPAVRAVLQDVKYLSLEPVIAGAAGTFPTMLVGDGDARVVVKFFGPLFHGPECAAIERELYALLARDPVIPAPRMLATTTLDAGSDWPWEVIVSTLMPGESLTSARERGDDSGATDALVHFLAEMTDRLAALTPAPDAVGVDALLADTWEPFLREQARTCVARHREWGDLPPHLTAQLDDWLDVDALLDEGAPLRALIHGDLHSDHLLGAIRERAWQPHGVIDFGDARIADRRYDLIPLFLDVFAGDREVLRAYLSAIEPDLTIGDFSRSMLALTILHEFRVLTGWLRAHPEAKGLPTLDALAIAIWG